MNSTQTYKNFLMTKLDVNEDELKKLFKNTLYPFKKCMEELGDNFLSSLMKLNYKRLVEYNKDDDDLHQVVCENNIDEERNVKNGNNFMCLCGKAHLKNLHIFSHENTIKNLVIGSSCIHQVEKLKLVYSENIELCNKLNNIISQLKTAEKRLTHKECYKCGDLSIKKNKDYPHPNQKIYCKDCLLKNKDFIKCECCFFKTIKGGQRDYHGKYKRICGTCWHNNNRNEEWYKRKYN